MKLTNFLPHRILFLLAGFTSLFFAILGIFLPILPTTPLVILAAYCFSKSSKKLHSWLVNNPYFGEMIKDWESYGMIPLKAKIIATSMIIPSFAYTFIFVPVAIWIKIIVAMIGFYALYFIWSRPETAQQSLDRNQTKNLKVEG